MPCVLNRLIESFYGLISLAAVNGARYQPDKDAGHKVLATPSNHGATCIFPGGVVLWIVRDLVYSTSPYLGRCRRAP